MWTGGNMPFSASFVHARSAIQKIWLERPGDFAAAVSMHRQGRVRGDIHGGVEIQRRGDINGEVTSQRGGWHFPGGGTPWLVTWLGVTNRGNQRSHPSWNTVCSNTTRPSKEADPWLPKAACLHVAEANWIFLQKNCINLVWLHCLLGINCHVFWCAEKEKNIPPWKGFCECHLRYWNHPLRTDWYF